VAVNLVTVAVAGVLVGGSWAFLHSTLQAWVTEVVPGERASAVALFAASLFLGSAAGTALIGPLAEAGAYGTMFGLAVVAAVPVAVASTLGRRTYSRRVRVCHAADVTVCGRGAGARDRSAPRL